MKIQVVRLNSSSYNSKDFLQQEAAYINKIEGVEYVYRVEDLSSDAKYVLISNTKTCFEKLDPTLLERTILIAHPNSGFDNVPANFASKNNLIFVKGNSIRSHAVAEFVLSAMMEHFCSIPKTIHWSSNRSWKRKRLVELDISIVGDGHVSQILQKALGPLAKNIHVIKRAESIKAENTDVLILVPSLNESTLNYLDKNTLAKLHDEVLIINPSRGQVINQEALVNFLERNSSAHAYLDVFQTEPADFQQFQHLKNLTVTSHIAGVFKDIDQQIINFNHRVISDFISMSSSAFLQSYNQEILNA